MPLVRLRTDKKISPVNRNFLYVRNRRDRCGCLCICRKNVVSYGKIKKFKKYHKFSIAHPYHRYKAEHREDTRYE